MDYDFSKQLCGNHKIYNEIISWLRTFYNPECPKKISENSCIFLSGNPCIGKTYSINKICEYLDLYVINIDINSCQSSIQFTDIIFKATSSSLIQSISNVSNKKIIIIDNYDSIYISNKAINQCLLKTLTEHKLKNIPIICITNINTNMKMGDIKRICKNYELSDPTFEDIVDVMKNSGKSEKEIKGLYKNANGNLLKIFCNNTLPSNHIDRSINVLELYGKQFNRNNIQRILNTDTWLTTLRFHENLISELTNRNTSYSKKKSFYKLFIKNFCFYDECMSNNNIEIAIDIFISTLYFLFLLKHKKGCESNMNNFTKILSYLSLQKKNIKSSYNTDFPLNEIGSYHVTLLSRKFIYFI
jgi:nucleoside-triphosphatase THEP1